jgi:hypothetical protein
VVSLESDPEAAIRALAPDGVDRIVEVALSANADLDAAVIRNGAVLAAYSSPDDRPDLPFSPMLFAKYTGAPSDRFRPRTRGVGYGGRPGPGVAAVTSPGQCVRLPQSVSGDSGIPRAVACRRGDDSQQPVSVAPGAVAGPAQVDGP